MSIVTISVTAYETVPDIYKMVDDLTNLNSEVVRTQEGDNLIIDFSDVIKDENKLKADESIILKILDNGGEIENYLFGIRQPSASASLKVPTGVPSRAFILWNINPVDQNVKNFGEWFANNADVWLNNTTDEIIYYNRPNPSDGVILKASEAEIIRQIDTGNYSFLTVAEVQAEVLNPDWVKL